MPHTRVERGDSNGGWRANLSIVSLVPAFACAQMTLLLGDVPGSSVVAESSVEVYIMQHTTLKEQLEGDPKIGLVASIRRVRFLRGRWQFLIGLAEKVKPETRR